MQFHLGILLVLYTNLAHGYVSTSFSAFTGAGSFALMTNDVRNRPGSRGTLEMKKGKSNVPINMRGNYEKQKQIKQAQEAMMAAQNPTDGKPVFNMYVKSKTGSGVCMCRCQCPYRSTYGECTFYSRVSEYAYFLLAVC